VIDCGSEWRIWRQNSTRAWPFPLCRLQSKKLCVFTGNEIQAIKNGCKNNNSHWIQNSWDTRLMLLWSWSLHQCPNLKYRWTELNTVSQIGPNFQQSVPVYMPHPHIVSIAWSSPSSPFVTEDCWIALWFVTASKEVSKVPIFIFRVRRKGDWLKNGFVFSSCNVMHLLVLLSKYPKHRHKILWAELISRRHTNNE
jgi:hypothetical protein